MKQTLKFMATLVATISAVAATAQVNTNQTSVTTTTTTESNETTTTTVTTTTVTNDDKVDYTPKIHGVIRTRWEGEFNDDDFGQRFQVRNARVSVEGNILKNLYYYIRIDACNQGKMQFLDAYARWSFLKYWRIQAGQYRVPYGVDAFRAPGTYYFTNRSFIGKHMLNMRQVGVKAGYYGKKVPLTIEAGVYNSASTANHAVWQHEMNFATKASYRISNVTITGSFITYQPDKVRINGADGAVSWSDSRWIVEGEYQYKHYVANRFKDVHAWNVFASYALPLKKTVFNDISFQGRFDGMTDHSTGTVDDNGFLTVNNPARRRITLGSTLTYQKKFLKTAIRLNYEKYFYDSNVNAPVGESDKIVAELVVKF